MSHVQSGALHAGPPHSMAQESAGPPSQRHFSWQLTQVSQVSPKQPVGTQVFDAASDDDLLSAWRGLGYYRRAQNLLKGAQFVVETFAGALPATVDELRPAPESFFSFFSPFFKTI